MKKLRDYSSISPSAKSLLMMKGYTNIPYARQTAASMSGPEIFNLDFDNKDFYFWLRVMHFESRYWSIDYLLKQTDHNNILELSSGYSLRGLDRCTKEAVHYIDTDLPDIINTKQQMIGQLVLGEAMKGQLTFQPLNALDEPAFNHVADRFEEGPLTIINEGLLMYLSTEEKKQLCHNIHNVLKKRGGSWITADIYVKRSADMRAVIPQSTSEMAFFKQHNIEENKFDNYEAAQSFFNDQGFELIKEAVVDFQKMSVIPHLLKALPPEMRERKEPPPKIQATWMLKAR